MQAVAPAVENSGEWGKHQLTLTHTELGRQCRIEGRWIGAEGEGYV